MSRCLKSYKCFYEGCELHKKEGRVSEEELIKDFIDEGHTDYRCPKCSSVIICIHYEI